MVIRVIRVGRWICKYRKFCSSGNVLALFRVGLDSSERLGVADLGSLSAASNQRGCTSADATCWDAEGRLSPQQCSGGLKGGCFSRGGDEKSHDLRRRLAPIHREVWEWEALAPTLYAKRLVPPSVEGWLYKDPRAGLAEGTCCSAVWNEHGAKKVVLGRSWGGRASGGVWEMQAAVLPSSPARPKLQVGKWSWANSFNSWNAASSCLIAHKSSQLEWIMTKCHRFLLPKLLRCVGGGISQRNTSLNNHYFDSTPSNLKALTMTRSQRGGFFTSVKMGTGQEAGAGQVTNTWKRTKNVLQNMSRGTCLLSSSFKQLHSKVLTVKTNITLQCRGRKKLNPNHRDAEKKKN